MWELQIQKEGADTLNLHYNFEGFDKNFNILEFVSSNTTVENVVSSVKISFSD
jgi:hypothetical protein